MTEPTRPEIGLGVCRSGVEACTDRSIEAIDAAVARCDYELAATIALARAKAGEPVPIAVACKILPGIELPAIVNALIAIATGDRSELMTILEHRRFPQTRENGELEAIVLYAAHRGGTPRERLIPELRRLAARTMFADGYALLAAIARDLDHPNVTMAVKQIASFADEYAKEVVATGKAHAASVTDVLAALPPNVQAAAGAVGFTVRAEKEPGRNDPCPCGSGLKYKKCHADKPVEAGSPIAGVSWEAFLTTSADQMTVDHVKALPLKELARTHLDRLAVPAHVEAIRQFAAAHEWTHAARALDALVPKDAKWADDARDMAIHEAQWCREHAFARAQIAQLSPDLAALFQLELAVEERPETRFAELVTAAEQAIRSDDRVAYVDLAYNLLRAAPPLGILAARACIGAWKIDDPQALLDSVEEVRDQLDLPPGDPAWDVVDAIAAKRPKRRGAAESDESVALRSTLAESAARADELERSLAAIRAQLDDARTLPAAELQRKTENRTALESKISELEGLIREGNAERRELRKQLTASQNDDDAKPAAPEKESDDGGEDLPETARGITIPRFDRRFIDSLEAIPQAVGAEAMRTIGTLSAGDGFAWLGVKQAKDMARQVLMARVGIHHRLLFRADAGILDVLDLVTRETLLATLKRMRANKT